MNKFPVAQRGLGVKLGQQVEDLRIQFDEGFLELKRNARNVNLIATSSKFVARADVLIYYIFLNS